jgi:hypothetical protein
VLDKDNQNAVLYERTVVDTPQVDRSLSSAELLAASGMNLACGPDVSGAPCTSGDNIGLASWQYSDGTKLAAEVTYDNFEQWTYQIPTMRYVDIASANPTPPYTNWATAATNIQDAVDAALAGDQIVVTNGIYATGGRAVGTNLLVNRVAVDKPLTLWSVNGPQFTPAHQRLCGCCRHGRRRSHRLAGVALPDLPHERTFGVAPALGVARRH